MVQEQRGRVCVGGGGGGGWMWGVRKNRNIIHITQQLWPGGYGIWEWGGK